MQYGCGWSIVDLAKHYWGVSNWKTHKCKRDKLV